MRFTKHRPYNVITYFSQESVRLLSILDCVVIRVLTNDFLLKLIRLINRKSLKENLAIAHAFSPDTRINHE